MNWDVNFLWRGRRFTGEVKAPSESAALSRVVARFVPRGQVGLVVHANQMSGSYKARRITVPEPLVKLPDPAKTAGPDTHGGPVWPARFG